MAGTLTDVVSADSPGDDRRKDWADLHVERLRGHWGLDAPVDADTEAIFIRMGRLMRHLRGVAEQAARQVGLEQFEIETLHHLLVRDTPGVASPTQLARDLGISPAGMTGRLSTLEKAGWIRRTTIPDDRRRVVVEITSDGVKIWRKAMALRGRPRTNSAPHSPRRSEPPWPRPAQAHDPATR